MIEQLYNIIDANENNQYDDYLLSLNGSVFKQIDSKDIALNQKKLTPFYMWETTQSIESSSAIVSTFDQFKYMLSGNSGSFFYEFEKAERDNKNRGNVKTKFVSASFGYVLSDKTLRYDTSHNGILYYYGYANRFGYGSPFNQTSSTATADIPNESKQLSPSRIAYKSIKNILSDENFIKTERIQKDNFFTDEFVYIKIPRNVYHEQLLNGSFQLALVDGPRKLFLADVSKYNSVYDEPSLAYLVSASNQNDIKYVSGNLDIYGLIDRKNALAIIDVPKLNNIFGNNMFVTESSKTQIKSFTEYFYFTDLIANTTLNSIDYIVTKNYTGSYYPNLENLSLLLYSGSLNRQLTAVGLETEISDCYYIKIGPGEFNRSTNPTYLINWKIKPEFMLNPITYITCIGLYNNEGDCLAVAKLSKPLKKEYNTSYVIKIELKQ